MRISRDQMFMDIAKTVAKRGTCDRARVGAVLTLDNNIISIGYNGAPSGEPHCDEVGHLMVDGHCLRTVHAEENCLSKISLQPSAHYVLYVTHYPCIKCQAVLFEACMKTGASMLVIYDKSYGNQTAISSRISDILQFTKLDQHDIM